ARGELDIAAVRQGRVRMGSVTRPLHIEGCTVSRQQAATGQGDFRARAQGRERPVRIWSRLNGNVSTDAIVTVARSDSNGTRRSQVSVTDSPRGHRIAGLQRQASTGPAIADASITSTHSQWISVSGS